MLELQKPVQSKKVKDENETQILEYRHCTVAGCGKLYVFAREEEDPERCIKHRIREYHPVRRL